MFSIARNGYKPDKFQLLPSDSKVFPQPIIEGHKELDAICPVNHLTGDRDNPLNLIGLILTDSKKQLLDRFIQEQAVNNEFKGMPDKEALDFVSDYLSNGMPAEKDQLLGHLQTIAETAMPALRAMIDNASHGSSKEESIEFTQEDVNTVEK